MLKKITVEDRQEALVAKLRTMTGDPREGCVPFRKERVKIAQLCALGVVCKLWPESIEWTQPISGIYAGAAALVGYGDEGRAIYRLNDQCETYPEVADKLERLFAGEPVDEGEELHVGR
jgi:hypothetical protein